MKRDNMLNHLAHTLPHWPDEYADMIEPGYGWAWYDEGEDCTLVLCKGEEEIREADYAARRAELRSRPEAKSDIKKCKHCDITFQRPHLDSVPDDRCMRCHEEIAAKGWDESRADTIGQNGNDGQHYPDTKTWWTSKACIECGRTTAAKVSDDRPVCPKCSVKEEDEFDASFRVFTEQAFPKQERYQDASGEDWIDEFARTATPEEFRGAMRFTIGKYVRRAGKKDKLESELRKIEDYARRWRQYEETMEGEE